MSQTPKPTRRIRKVSLSPEEKEARKVRARRHFKGSVRFAIRNIFWLKADIPVLEEEEEDIKPPTEEVVRAESDESVEVEEKKVAVSGKIQEFVEDIHAVSLTTEDKILCLQNIDERSEAEKNRIKKLVGSLKCFQRYPIIMKNQVTALMYFAYYPPGRIIIKQDRESWNMYLIVSGRIKVTQVVFDPILKKTVTEVVGYYGSGYADGEYAILHNLRRTTTFETVTDVELLYLKKDDFDNLIEHNVAHDWEIVCSNMKRFGYFDEWTDIMIREASVVSKLKDFEPDEHVLSDMYGSHKYVYFIYSGYCNLYEQLFFETYKVGPATKFRWIPKVKLPVGLSENEDQSSVHLAESEGTLTKDNIESHFMKIATLETLACFNLGESLHNRFIIAGEKVSCFLIPRYFLHGQAYGTFKSMERFLNTQLPNHKAVFNRYVETVKWEEYKKGVIDSILKGKSPVNYTHNIPLNIRLNEDVHFSQKYSFLFKK